MLPRTSFVIATRDRANELADTLARLLRIPDCPIIVVDNGSRDSTRDVVDVVAHSHPEGRRVEVSL